MIPKDVPAGTPGPDDTVNPDAELPRTPPDPFGHAAPERRDVREKMLDKTIADSFPTSDPPSTIPDPSADDSIAA
ncbi:MAG: hypothetical protein ACE14L_05610 [Terriglobales bacterium]